MAFIPASGHELYAWFMANQSRVTDLESRLADALAANKKAEMFCQDLLKAHENCHTERDRLAAEVERLKEQDRRRGADRLKKAVSQEHITPDTIDAQFCSDHLKREIAYLFQQLDAARVEASRIAEALRWIKDAKANIPVLGIAGRRWERDPVTSDLQWVAAEALRPSPNAVELLESVRGMERALANAMQVCTCPEGLAQEPIDKHTNPNCCMVMESRALERFRKAWGQTQ